MKTTTLLLALACLTLTACDRDRNKCKPTRPPAEHVEKVPDSGATLALSLVAGCVIALGWVYSRKERAA